MMKQAVIVGIFAALAACGEGKSKGDGAEDGAPDSPDAQEGDVPDTAVDDAPDREDSEDIPAEEIVPECTDPEPVPEGFHVSPSGTATGDGSEGSPWDLATALAHPAALQPGDIVWLHGGVYAGSFTCSIRGEEGNPVTVRSYPGEWAVVDGASSVENTFSFEGAWAVYRDFEVTNSNPERYGGRPEGVYVTGDNLRLINLVIHDTGNNGFWSSALDLELYGCLIYNNGYDDADRAHGHGVYTQNLDGTKRIADNLIFNGYSFGIHAYTEGGSIQGFDIIGNVWFGSGVAAAGTDTLKDNCLVGGLQPAARILLRENLGWAGSGTTRSVRLGYDNPDNQDVTLEDNFFVGATEFAQPWVSITMTGNTFFSEVSGVDTALYPDNTYLSDRPTGMNVFVRPNAYEPMRAHVVVYNWDLAETAEVDLGDVLAPGAAYEVKNAQDYFGEPVASGVFDGAPVALPLTGLEPVQPVGSPGAIDASEMTGPGFNVFVVTGRCL